MLRKLRDIEHNFNLNKAAAIIGALTFASAFMGFIRDRLFASYFGAGDTLDVYYAAFHIPDFLYNLLVLGTLSVAFIPIFTEWLLKDKKRAYHIANSILNASVALMAVCCGVLYVFSVQLTHLLVPGFSQDKFSQTLMLTRLFLLSPIIFTASSVFGSILNSQKRFLMANLAPIVYNCGIIFGLLYLYPIFGLRGLGYGVIIGALLHLGIQAAEAVRLGFSWQSVMDLKNEAVRQFGKLFVPRIFGLDTSQISLLIGSMIGSLLASGTIAVLNLANNLRAVPVNVFGASLAMASFPLLSEQHAKKEFSQFITTLADTCNRILFFALPITIFTFLFRAYIVRLAYGAGHFSWNNTVETINTLGIFAVSFFSQSLSPLFARAFYARHNTKTPVMISLGTLALNIALSYIFATHDSIWHISLLSFNFSLQTGGAPGIALGFSIASIINATLLFLMLRASLAKDIRDEATLKQFDGSISAATVKILAASIFTYLIGHIAIYAFEPLVNTRTAIGILIQSGCAALVAAAAFFIAARKLKLDDVFNLSSVFARFFKRT